MRLGEVAYVELDPTKHEVRRGCIYWVGSYKVQNMRLGEVAYIGLDPTKHEIRRGCIYWVGSYKT